jgi:hypothetical protein
LLSAAARKKKPSRHQIMQAVKDLATIGREAMAERLKVRRISPLFASFSFAPLTSSSNLQKAKGSMYVTLDGWQTPNNYSIIGLFVRYRLINAKGKSESHTTCLDFKPYVLPSSYFRCYEQS